MRCTPLSEYGKYVNKKKKKKKKEKKNTLSGMVFRLSNIKCPFKGVLHLWALFLKTLCIFSKNKATSDKVSYGSGQKCSKEFKNYSFTSVETIVVKLQ